MDSLETAFVSILGVIFLALAALTGARFQRDMIHKDAVEMGHGHWEVSSSGKATFQWGPKDD